MVRIENALDRCMSRLNERRNQTSLDCLDEIDSVLSTTQSSFSLLNRSTNREAELLKNKILALELENSRLRKEMESMKGSDENVTPDNEDD